MRPRHSRPLNNHKNKFPQPTTSRITRTYTLVGTSAKSLFRNSKLLPGIASGVLFLILKVLLILALAIFIASWVFGEDSITIASFIDLSPSPQENTAPKNKGLGQFVADGLAFELDRISQLQTVKNPWGSPEQIGSPKVTTPEAYERVGSISVSGIELPVGELLLALKSFLPYFNQRQAITGSIQRFSSDKTGRMRIIARLEEHGKILKHWEIDKDLKTEAEIVDLVKNLAFQITWSTLNEIGTSSFYSFQYYIDGIEFFRRYKDTHDENYFFTAEQKLLAAIKEHPGYVKAHFFLGSLYSWRFFYEQFDVEMMSTYAKSSTDAFERIETLYIPHEHKSKALASYGLGLLAYRRYLKEKQRNDDTNKLYEQESDNSDLWLNEAEMFYTKALIINPNLYFARAGRALIYQERRCFDHAIQELQESSRHARAEEKRLAKNKKNKEWIERQIDQIQGQKKREAEEPHEIGAKVQNTNSPSKEGNFNKRNIISRLLATFSWSSSQEACI
jgi:hypothetical protein